MSKLGIADERSDPNLAELHEKARRTDRLEKECDELHEANEALRRDVFWAAVALSQHLFKFGERYRVTGTGIYRVLTLEFLPSPGRVRYLEHEDDETGDGPSLFLAADECVLAATAKEVLTEKILEQHHGEHWQRAVKELHEISLVTSKKAKKR